MQFTTAIVSTIAAFTFVQPIAAGTIVKGIFGKRSMVRGESNIFDRAAPAAGESASTNPVQCFEEGKGATIKVKANGPSSWTIHNVPASCETLAEHLASAKDVRYGTIVVNGDKSVTISNLPAAEVPKFKEWAAGHP